LKELKRYLARFIHEVDALITFKAIFEVKQGREKLREGGKSLKIGFFGKIPGQMVVRG
jgi:hypothetical protein